MERDERRKKLREAINRAKNKGRKEPNPGKSIEQQLMEKMNQIQVSPKVSLEKLTAERLRNATPVANIEDIIKAKIMKELATQDEKLEKPNPPISNITTLNDLIDGNPLKGKSEGSKIPPGKAVWRSGMEISRKLWKGLKIGIELRKPGPELDPEQVTPYSWYVDEAKFKKYIDDALDEGTTKARKEAHERLRKTVYEYCDAIGLSHRFWLGDGETPSEDDIPEMCDMIEQVAVPDILGYGKFGELNVTVEPPIDPQLDVYWGLWLTKSGCRFKVFKEDDIDRCFGDSADKMRKIFKHIGQGYVRFVLKLLVKSQTDAPENTNVTPVELTEEEKNKQIREAIEDDFD
jgi:hypothetical protein